MNVIQNYPVYPASPLHFTKTLNSLKNAVIILTTIANLDEWILGSLFFQVINQLNVVFVFNDLDWKLTKRIPLLILYFVYISFCAKLLWKVLYSAKWVCNGTRRLSWNVLKLVWLWGRYWLVLITKIELFWLGVALINDNALFTSKIW